MSFIVDIFYMTFPAIQRDAAFLVNYLDAAQACDANEAEQRTGADQIKNKT
jgi:hypothetical protein